jgi:hypothetical protein
MALTAGKLGAVHEQIVDYMVANPGARAPEVAEYFKYSPSYIYALTNNDLFKARLMERQALVSAHNARQVAAQLHQLAEVGLRKLLEKVNVEEKHSELRETVKLALQGTGHISPKGNGPVHSQTNVSAPTVHFHGVDKNLLETARAKMLGLSTPVIQHAPQLPEG